MNIYITEPGIKEYPPHTHEYWEIITYSEGTGYLYTPDKNYHFKPGTVIIVPPHTVHGSVSESGFVNISNRIFRVYSISHKKRWYHLFIKIKLKNTNTPLFVQ